MSALLIENAEGIFTGLPGEAMRARGRSEEHTSELQSL